MARLVLRAGEGGGWVAWDLPGGELFLGREDGCQLVVLERSISRRHARLVLTEAGWCVYDEVSGNGTFVNGYRVSDALLRHGDEVRFGMVGGWFEEPPDGESPTIPAVPPPRVTVPPPPPPVPPPPPIIPAGLEARRPVRPAAPRVAGPPRPVRPPRPERRSGALPAVLAVALVGVALAGGAAFLLLRDRGGPGAPAPGGETRGAAVAPEEKVPLGAAAAVDAGDAERLGELLEGGANPNAVSDDGLNLVHRAAWAGNAAVAKLLVSKGADLFGRDPLGMTPASRAFAEGRCDVALLLVPKEPTPAGEDGRGYLHFAAEGGCAGAVERLVGIGAVVDAPDAAGLTPLHVAALAGRADVAAALLAKGAAIGRATAAGLTPLHLASLGGHAEAVKALLAKGADPNAKDARGRTPLHLAAANGNAETLSALLAAKADPASAGPEGTPLDVALAAAAWDAAELLAPPDA